MIFFKRFAMLVYVTILLFFSCGILLLALNLIDPHFAAEILFASFYDQRLRIVFGIFGALLLILNFMFYQFFSINVHREKIIAFDNPTGRVTVSLIAMEDLVKRIVLKFAEIKDVRPTIKAIRGGLNVHIRLVMFGDAHIPDVTARIQTTVAKKIQEAIGLSEPINIEIYVNKIIAEPLKGSKGDDSVEESQRLNIPFQGYRA